MKAKILAIFFITIGNIVFSQTVIPGGYVYGTWNNADSPYLINGSIMIPSDSTLIIEHGVTVEFQGHYKLLVSGQLLAIGNNMDSIYFTATDSLIGWYGVRFDNTSSINDTSIISFCKIKWGIAYGTGNDGNGGAIMLNNFSKVIISNCNILENSSYGGAIFTTNSSPLIENNKISNCQGGGIRSTNNSNPQIINNIISDNNGPGIVIIGGDTNMYIKNNIITYNTKSGIYISESSLNIINNDISRNSSQMGAGGIWCDNSSALIDGNTITYNTNNSTGGGIFNYFGSSIISNNYICNNHSDEGGGIYSTGNGNSSYFINNLIANNEGNTNGGGILINGDTPILINNTIVNNVANDGGGIFFYTNSIITNTIIYGNIAFNEGNQVFLSDEQCDPDFYYSNIQGGTPSFGLNGNFYSGNFQNNIDENPEFIDASLGNGISYDGINSDWNLSISSPCINAGDPNGTYLPVDINGENRVYNNLIDIGAYENQELTSFDSFKCVNNSYLYPNPTNGEIFIKNNQVSDIFIININGEEVLHSTQTTFIDLSSLNKGVYFAKIYQNKQIIIQKIIVK